MQRSFDIAVIGGGVVGLAILRRFALSGLSAVLLERGADILSGASKGNSALLHTGFDAPTGSTELACMQAGYAEYLDIHEELNLPLVKSSALVVAWGDEEQAKLDGIVAKATLWGAMQTIVIADAVMSLDNVVAIGNAAGFVEPLEATALMIVCSHSQSLVNFLIHSKLDPTPSMIQLYNEVTKGTWHETRDFLGLHYKVNLAPTTPFWQHCRAETDLSGIGGLLEFYEENGPTGFCRYRMPASQSDFGIEGYFVMLVGNKVPHRKRHQPTVQELSIWEAHRTAHMTKAMTALSVKEALACIRRPNWQWDGAPPPRKR